MTMVSDWEPRFSGFHELMPFRVREILLVSSPYDAFVLEEDGQLSDKIFGEYVDLNLQFVPRITRVETAEQAFRKMRERTFELVITMTRIADMNPLEFGRRVKDDYPERAVVMLSYETISPEFLQRVRVEKGIDKVFYWTGNSRILLAIVKYIEDKLNTPSDIRQGVQVILVVEDSPRYYSMFLPLIYTEIMKQTQYLIAHGVNNLHRLLRMRARPKILLAETFEEAMAVGTSYRHNLLGVISDVRFPLAGAVDPAAGFQLAERLKAEIDDLPVLLQSEEPLNSIAARRRHVAFLDKNSPELLQELSDFIKSNFGFGAFVFRYPDGREIASADNLSQFETAIRTLPEESLLFHAGRNHFSRWLRARTEFRLAEEIRPKKVSDFRDTGEMRRFILECISRLFDRIQKGVVTDFGQSKFDSESSFVKLGGGSLGGKGRGVAFMNSMLASINSFERYTNVTIKTPHSFIIGSDLFDRFMEQNHLLDFVLNVNDETLITERFLQAALPEELTDNLRTMLEKVNYPLAVRSSSILEDSQMLPFAGLYHTYMIPNNHLDPGIRLLQLTAAVKLVYASVFYRSPKEYVKNADMRIADEKMAVLIQQVAGSPRGDLFYPVISGVAQSYNFYPISLMQPEEGVVGLALGLGRTIVEGGRIFRFCPSYPQMNPPFSSAAEFMRKTQSEFYALDMDFPDVTLCRDEHCSLRLADLIRAEADGVLPYVASTYSREDHEIKDTLFTSGPRVLTFAPILKYDQFPLAAILKDFLNLGRQAFGAHVEIEFAMDFLPHRPDHADFYFLQIRPMVVGRELPEVDTSRTATETILGRSRHTMGNGVFTDLHDVVYVDPRRFDPSVTPRIAAEIGEVCQGLGQEGRSCILIGFGRFGTSDPWLGIPVDWYQMASARVVVECNLDRFNVDPSQGSHFFHNLIALKMGYFHIPRQSTEEFIDWEWLQARPSRFNGEYVRHLRFEHPVMVKIDGRSSRGLLLKPETR